jgi:hypothetical protein
MALTPELIKQQEPLKGLTDEQITAIATLSVNDENTVIGQRIGKIYGDLDNDIKETFGVEKQQGEKTYDLIKRVGKTISDKLAEVKDLPGKYQALEREKQELEQKIKDGKGSEAISQKLKDTEDRLADMQKKYQKDVDEWKGKATDYEKRVQTIQVDYEFEKAIAGLQFKPEYSEDITNLIVTSAKSKLMSTYKPDWIDDGKGGKTLVFRDKDGVIQNNPEKGLNPYNASDLIRKELSSSLAPMSGGAGTGPNGKKEATVEIISAAKTQVEANDLIEKHLLAKGVVKNSKQWVDELTAIRKENKINELPIK